MSAHLVWIDLEMTGLDITRESIIEIATVVTDGDLNVLATGPNLAISVDEALLAGMDDWNTRHHHRSGLVDRIRSEGVSVDEAEQATLACLREWVDENTAPLCGNSVWNDRQFMAKEMPELDFSQLARYEREDRGQGARIFACVGGGCDEI